MRDFRFVLTALLALIIASCGWHLRGIEPLAEELQVLHLDAREPDGEFARTLQRSLTATGVSLLESRDEAPIVLEVSPAENQRRTISTSDLGKAAEYQLTTSIDFRVLNAAGEEILGPERLQVEKVYVFDRLNVASTYEEEQLLRKEMRRDLVRKLIRRYQSVSQTGQVN
jgi:LPS-assembly lipoprotein